FDTALKHVGATILLQCANSHGTLLHYSYLWRIEVMPKLLSMFAALVLLCCPTLVKAATCTQPNSIVLVKNSVAGAFAYVEFRVKLPIKPSFSFTVTNVAGGTFVHDASGATITVPG